MLTSHLGDPQSKPLTVAQFRNLSLRMKALERPEGDRQLTLQDLLALGFSEPFGRNILHLLARDEELEYYVNRAKQAGCYPITRISQNYPGILRDRLGENAPGCLWYKGDLTLLSRPCVAVVGSRELRQENVAFAIEVGRQAAKQGFALVSGNARGADRTAQDSCLEHGGQVISIVADSLEKCPPSPGILYLSEDGYSHGFSSQRALSRNRLIHSLAGITVVVQSRFEQGGTWKGTQQNLRRNWSPVFCFQDGSQAALELAQMGASLIDIYDLSDMESLRRQHISFFE